MNNLGYTHSGLPMLAQQYDAYLQATEQKVSNLSTSQHNTRGHSKKLAKSSSQSETYQTFFLRRVINHQNKLKDLTVSPPSIQSFKNQPDME